MKKILSLALAVIMLVSAVPMVYAAENETDYTNGTAVEYVATGTEQYTVTVPAKLAPGESGTVTATGTFDRRHTLLVKADTTVTLECSLSSADEKILPITFNQLVVDGSNIMAVGDSETITVGEIEKALFGTWSGTFNYTVELVTGYYDLPAQPL